MPRLRGSVRSILCCLLAAGLAVSVPAQQTSPSPVQKDAVPASPVQSADAEKAESDAIKLVEASGGRQAMEKNLDKMLADGKEALLRSDPSIDPRFADEWVKRMKERTNFDDYVKAIAKVYASYLTDEEILELTDAMIARRESKDHPISDHLKQKLSDNAVKIQSDVMAETSRIGGRLGGEVGQEIGKEHPDWVKTSKPSGDSTKQ
jgi:hypothetical protein